MAATKNARTIQSSASNSAGGTTTSSSLDLTTRYGGTLTVKMTNGATGPTVACSGYIEISHDNSAWKTFNVVTGGVANNGVYEFAVEVPAAVMYLRTRFADNTGQAVTVEAFLHELTTI